MSLEKQLTLPGFTDLGTEMATSELLAPFPSIHQSTQENYPTVEVIFEEMSEAAIATHSIASQTRVSVPTRTGRVTVTATHETLARKVRGQIQGLSAFETVGGMPVYNGKYRSTYTIPDGTVIGVQGKHNAIKLKPTS